MASPCGSGHSGVRYPMSSAKSSSVLTNLVKSQELCMAQLSSSSFACLWLVPLSMTHGRRPGDLISSLSSSSLPPGNRREDVELEGKAQGRVGAATCCSGLPLRCWAANVRGF